MAKSRSFIVFFRVRLETFSHQTGFGEYSQYHYTYREFDGDMSWNFQEGLTKSNYEQELEKARTHVADYYRKKYQGSGTSIHSCSITSMTELLEE